MIVIIGPLCAKNVAKMKMTVLNVLIGLDFVKPAVQCDEKYFNKEEPSLKVIFFANLPFYFFGL